jgi:hypothetical protein
LTLVKFSKIRINKNKVDIPEINPTRSKIAPGETPPFRVVINVGYVVSINGEDKKKFDNFPLNISFCHA